MSTIQKSLVELQAEYRSVMMPSNAPFYYRSAERYESSGMRLRAERLRQRAQCMQNEQRKAADRVLRQAAALLGLDVAPEEVELSVSTRQKIVTALFMDG